MPNFKGSGIVVLDTLLRARGSGARSQFLSLLTLDERQHFVTAVPAGWVPIEIADSLSAKAAGVLFPNDPQALFKLGMARAREQVKGIYRVLFKIITTDTIINNAATLWPYLHDQGKARVETIKDKKIGYYFINGYPTLTPNMRQLIEGFIHALVSMSGVKNVQTRRFEDNPDEWKWMVTWE